MTIAFLLLRCISNKHDHTSIHTHIFAARIVICDTYNNALRGDFVVDYFHYHSAVHYYHIVKPETVLATSCALGLEYRWRKPRTHHCLNDTRYETDHKYLGSLTDLGGFRPYPTDLDHFFKKPHRSGINYPCFYLSLSTGPDGGGGGCGAAADGSKDSASPTVPPPSASRASTLSLRGRSVSGSGSGSTWWRASSCDSLVTATGLCCACVDTRPVGDGVGGGDTGGASISVVPAPSTRPQ